MEPGWAAQTPHQNTATKSVPAPTSAAPLPIKYASVSLAIIRRRLDGPFHSGFRH
jgi:hypothetical protein